MEFILIILSSLLFTIPLYHPALFFLSWFAFIPLIYLTNEYDYSHSFIIALMVGFLTSLISFYWIYHPIYQTLNMPFSFNIFIMFIYFLFSALPLVIWTLTNKFLQPKYSYSPIIAALSWSVLEYLRFEFLNINPFNYFAYTQSSFSLFTHYASYGGIFLVSFIAVLIASYFVKIFLKPSWKKIIPVIFIFIVLIVIPLFRADNTSDNNIQEKISVLNFNLVNYQNQFKKIEKEINLLNNLIKGNESNYIFSSENILSFDLLKNSYYRNILYSQLKDNLNNSYLQLGVRSSLDGSYNTPAYNSLFLLNNKPEIINRYTKETNILSSVNLRFKKEIIDYFSEYLNLTYPIKKEENLKIVSSDKLNYLNLMSEEIYSSLVLDNDFLENDLNLIVNSAAEEDFSSEIYNNLSLAAAVFRAAETKTPVIRAVKGGYSAYINSSGKVVWKSKLKNNIKNFNLDLNSRDSFYQKHPHKIIYIFAVLLSIIIFFKLIIISRDKLSSRN